MDQKLLERARALRVKYGDEEATRFQRGFGRDYRPEFDAQAREDAEESSFTNEMQAAGYGWLAGMGRAGDAIGLDTGEWAAEMEEAQARNLAASDWTKSYKDVDSIGSGFSYLGHNLVQSLPFIAEVGAGALTGGAGFGLSLGKAGAKGALARGATAAAAKTQTAKQAARQATRIAAAKQVGMETAKQEARTQAGRTFARRAGGLAASYPSSVGQIASAQYEQSEEYNTPVALAGGVPFAALNMLGVEGALLRGLPKSAVEKRLLRSGAIGLGVGAQEGAAEVTQGLIEEGGRASVDPNYQFDEAARDRLTEAAIAGFTVGSSLGTAGGVFSSPETEIDYDDEAAQANMRDTQTLLSRLTEGERAMNNRLTAEQAEAEASERAALNARLEEASAAPATPYQTQPMLPMEMPQTPEPAPLMQPPVPQAEGPVLETPDGQLPLPMSRIPAQGEIVSPDATFTPLETTPDMFEQEAPEQYFESDWTPGELLARAARTLTDDPGMRSQLRANPDYRDLARKLSDAMRLNDAAEVDLILEGYQADPAANPEVGVALTRAVDQWRAASGAYYRQQGRSRPRPSMTVKPVIRRLHKRLLEVRSKARDGSYSNPRNAQKALDRAEDNLDAALETAYPDNTPQDRAAFRQRLLDPASFPDFANSNLFDPNASDPNAPMQGPPAPTPEQQQIEMDLQGPMQGPPPPLDRMQPRPGDELPLGPGVDPAQQRLPFDTELAEQAEAEARRAEQEIRQPDLTPVEPAQGELGLETPTTPADPAQEVMDFEAEPVPAPEPVGEGDASKDAAAAKVFNDTLADAQRGKPETAMLRVQKALGGGGVLASAVEHIGDITHRVAQKPEAFAGREGADKVTSKLGSLKNEYGFEREHRENVTATAEFTGKSVEEVDAALDAALEEYALEHSKLPVYNRNQWLAREAAVALGNKDWQRATEMLEGLQETIDADTFAQENMKFTRNPDGSLQQYVPEPEPEPEAARTWTRLRGGEYQLTEGDKTVSISKQKSGWIARADFDTDLYSDPFLTLREARADAEAMLDDPYLTGAQEARRTSQHFGLIAVTETFAENVGDVDAALRKELKRMGLGRIKLRIRDKIESSNSETGEKYAIEGSFINDIITVALDAKRGVMSAMKHETIHALRQAGVFTPGEWKALTRYAKRRQKKAMAAYSDLSPEKQLEEAVAVAYQDFFEGRAKPQNMVGRALTKVKNVLAAIGNALTGAGFNSGADILARVESGEVGARAPSQEAGGDISFSTREGRGREFDTWFEGSKIVDENGEPLTVYHGTSKDSNFKSFKRSNRGIWFTSNPEAASMYAAENDSRKLVRDESPGAGPWDMVEKNTADRVIPVNLAIKNPYTLTQEEMDAYRTGNGPRIEKQFVDKAKRLGHDGIDLGNEIYIAFEPSQIKSVFNPMPEGAAQSPQFSRADALDGEAPRSFQVTEGGVEQVDGVGSFQEAKTGGRSLTRQAALKSMTIRQIVEVYEKIPEFGPALKNWFDNLTLVGAKAERGKRTADVLYRRWNNLVTEEDQVVSDLMSDSTWHQVDPRYGLEEGPNSGLTNEQRKKHVELRNKYLGLGEEAKSVYGDILDLHETNWKARYEAMKSLVSETSGLSSTQQREIMRDLDSLYGRIRVYAPLMRFGKYSLVAKSPEVIAAQARVDAATAVIRNLDENLTDEQKAAAEIEVQEAKAQLEEANADGYFYMRYDQTGARQSAAEHLVEQGFAVQKYDGGDYSNGFDTIAPDFMRRLEQSFAGEENGDMFMRLARQAYVQSLPEGAAAKRGLERKNVKGYSRNAKRAFVANAQSVSHQLAKLEYAASSRETMQALIDAQKQIGGADNPNADAAAAVLEQVRQHQEAAMDWVDTPLQDMMTNMSHLYFLAITPSFLMLNMLQPFMVSAPMMASRHGAKAYARQAAWAKRMAGKKASYGAALDINEITDDPSQRQFLEYVEERAMIDLDQTMDMGAEASTGMGRRWKKMMEGVNRPIHVTERVNRLSTGLAAFEMEYDRLLKEGKKKGEAQRLASEYGAKMITDSHFDYSATNAPWLWKTPKLPMSKVMLQFRKYQQHMIFAFVNNARNSFGDVDAQTKSEARRTLIGLLATHGIVAGSLGLPGADAALWGIGLVGSMLYGEDEPFDPRTEYRRYLSDVLGPDAAQLIAKGLPAALGVDISQRQGVGNLFTPLQPRVAGLKPREEWNAYVASLLGPFGTVGGDIYQAANDLEDDWGRATEMLMPKAIRDLVKANRYSEEGLRTRRGMPMVGPEEIEGHELLLQALGLTPSRLTEFYEGRSSVLDYKTQIDTRRSNLIRQWADAKEDGDQDLMDELQSQVDKFNETRTRLADKPVITKRDLMAALRRRNRYGRETIKGVRLRRSERGLADVGSYANTFE